MANEIPQFGRMLKKHGLIIHPTDGSHTGIYRGGKRIYTMGATPKNAYHAVENTIKDLVLAKHLPDNTIYRGRIYKRKRPEKRMHD
jgi:hypothetical protein